MLHSRPRRLAATTGAALLTAGVVGAAPAQAAVPNPVDLPATGVSADVLPTAQINGIAWDQAIVGTTVYVGGEFTAARPAGAPVGTSESPRANLMSYNLTTGVMTTWAPKVNGKIRTVTASPDGTRLYIGGSFTTVDGQPRSRIAAFNTADGTLVRDFAPTVGSDVLTIAAGTKTVYLGGWFGSVNGVARSRLAAVSTTGATTAWAPTVDNAVEAMVLSSDATKVVIGGGFAKVNGTFQPSLAGLDAGTGASYPFAANKTIDNSSVGATGGSGAGIKSIQIKGSSIYASAWSYGLGRYEGVVKADVATGAIQNMLACNGDSYDATPMNGLIYAVSHHHRCDQSGGFPQQTPAVYQHSDAITDTAAGTVGGGGRYDGHPSGSYVNWFPTWRVGPLAAGSKAGQAGWTVESSGKYLVVGGEFPAVNGVPQQGLVRFATRDIAPNKEKPQSTTAAATPTVSALSPTSVRVTVTSPWDRDNLAVRTKVYRVQNGVKTLVHDATLASPWWKRPVVTFDDVKLSPSTSYSYYVESTDANSNTFVGPRAAFVTAAQPTPTTPAPTATATPAPTTTTPAPTTTATPAPTTAPPAPTTTAAPTPRPTTTAVRP